MSRHLTWVVTAVLAGLPPGTAGAQAWRLHAAIEGERPFLCKDADSIGMVVDVAARAQEARAQRDTEKAERLLDLAGRLQAEICRRPAADDVIILRCRVKSRTIAGVAISTVKVSALLRAEPSQGEQPFFAWKAGAIEDAPAGDATTQADSRWCDTDEPVQPTADIVLRLQHRFYDFGMHIPQVNGQLTPETVQAISNFQKWAGLPVNGRLTRLTLQKVDDTPAPSPWAAIAFDGFGKFGAVTGATRRGAESDAITRLRQRSRADFKVSSVPSPRCLAIATVSYRERTGRRRVTTFTQAFTRGGDTREDAAQKVMQYCETEKGGGSCQVRESICTVVAQAPPRPEREGSVPPRFDHDAPPVNAGPPPRFDRGAPPVNAAPPRFDPTEIPANARPPRN